MEGVPGGGSIMLNPNRPEPYGGRRDYLVVSTWLYNMEQYLLIVQLVNPNSMLSDGNRIIYASPFFTGTAPVWWYTIVQSNEFPTTSEKFEKRLISEFVPSDHVRRARAMLRRLNHTSSVSKYLDKFGNIILTIPDVTDGEKLDRFCSGIKY